MTDLRVEQYADLAEAGWRWVLDQVRWDDGPWIPVTVPPASEGIPEYRDEMHSGIGGLAHVLAEIRLARPWTDEEAKLAEGIATRVRAGVAATTSYTYFEGLVSDLGVLTALETHGAAEAITRLDELATPDGWPQTMVGPPRYLPTRASTTRRSAPRLSCSARSGRGATASRPRPVWPGTPPTY